MTVYVVTAGDYDDYHIEAVFSTHEKAVEYKYNRPDLFNDIETYEVDSEAGKKFTIQYEHVLTGSGETSRTSTRVVEVIETITARGDGIGQTRDKLSYDSVWSETSVFYGISYISTEHAKKLAVEERQKYLREHA